MITRTKGMLISSRDTPPAPSFSPMFSLELVIWVGWTALGATWHGQEVQAMFGLALQTLHLVIPMGNPV